MAALLSGADIQALKAYVQVLTCSPLPTTQRFLLRCSHTAALRVYFKMLVTAHRSALPSRPVERSACLQHKVALQSCKLYLRAAASTPWHADCHTGTREPWAEPGGVNCPAARHAQQPEGRVHGAALGPARANYEYSRGCLSVRGKQCLTNACFTSNCPRLSAPVAGAAGSSMGLFRKQLLCVPSNSTRVP